jgi:peptidoglycan/LPS O-acetylase OafA/YrhL
VLGVLLILVSLGLRDEFFRQTLRYSLQGVGLFLLIGAIVCGNVPRLVGAVLGSAALGYIGRISYSLYLYHLTVLAYLDRLDLLQPVARALVGALLSFVLASLSYHAIERPFLRLRRSFGSHATN